MSVKVIAVFDGTEDLNRAVDALIGAGFNQAAICCTTFLDVSKIDKTKRSVYEQMMFPGQSLLHVETSSDGQAEITTQILCSNGAATLGRSLCHPHGVVSSRDSLREELAFA